MGPIICATDYSKNSISTLQFGHAISKKLKTELIVMHVFDINVALVTPMSMTFAQMQNDAFKKHHEKLSSFCEEHLGVLPDDRHLSVMVKENAIIEEELLQTIHDHNAEILLMGMKGTSALKDIIFGSSTKSMIDKSPCPVLAVPPNFDSFDLDVITYATDFEESDVHALNWLIETFAKPLECQVNIVHFAIDKEDDEADQMEWFKKMLQLKITYGNISYDVIEQEDVITGLMDYLEISGSKLVAMLEREHRGFLKNWTHTDKVKLMSVKGKFPVLSFNKKKLSS
jgi:nucleotide-binding universal stress UspA family protein